MLGFSTLDLKELDVDMENFTRLHLQKEEIMEINGKEVKEHGHTIQTFLDSRSIRKDMVVIEINGLIVEQHEYLTRMLKPEDKVEIVSFVGGG